MVANTQKFDIAVVPGDGIGQEIMFACTEVLQALGRKHGIRFDFNKIDAGAAFYTRTGIDIKDEDFIPYCDASYKLSIKFTDFYQKGESFHYPFGDPYLKGNVNNLNDWWFKKFAFPETDLFFLVFVA